MITVQHHNVQVAAGNLSLVECGRRFSKCRASPLLHSSCQDAVHTPHKPSYIVIRVSMKAVPLLAFSPLCTASKSTGVHHSVCLYMDWRPQGCALSPSILLLIANRVRERERRPVRFGQQGKKKGPSSVIIILISLAHVEMRRWRAGAIPCITTRIRFRTSIPESARR